jgi:hypothetical protein
MRSSGTQWARFLISGMRLVGQRLNYHPECVCSLIVGGLAGINRTSIRKRSTVCHTRVNVYNSGAENS